jgi:predicted kinase
MGSGPEAMLIILSGRSGVGKTTLAHALASATSAVHLRIDSIEQALRRCGVTVEAEGYAVAYAVAEDNLRLGRTVIADSVNPWPLTRDAWRNVAARAGVPAIDLEIVCSDPREHRRRVKTRVTDVPDLVLPTWPEVVERNYRPWDGERLVIATAGTDVDDSVRTIVTSLRTLRPL